MSIEGVWYNELNSMMELKVKGSSISGRYNTKVGDAEGWYELVGWVGGKRPNQSTLGFVVLWENDKRSTDSVTVWTGEWFIDPDSGHERIEMMWLLAKETTPADEWTSTKIGKDIFSRNQISSKTMQALTKLRAPSHPQSAAG
jgi:Avidin family